MKKSKNVIRLINTSRQKASSALSVGMCFEGSATQISDTGNGIIIHPSGIVVFVPGLWLGERAQVRVCKVKKQFAEAQIMNLFERSPERRDPPCKFHGFSSTDCGGCPWMFIDYSAQLQAKQLRVEHAMQKIQPSAKISPILASPSEYAYRVRAQLKTNGKQIGFVANGLRKIVDIDQCMVMNAGCQKLLTDLRGQLPNEKWKPIKSHEWSTIDIESLTGEEGVRLNQRLPFKQVNFEQNKVMQNWLKSRLQDLPEHSLVVELFAGSGNLTEILVECGFTNIVTVEVVADAVSAAQDRQWSNVRGELCDLFNEQEFRRFWRVHQDTEILVLDPPRDGLKVYDGLIQKKSKLKDVIYISCNLATLCRDLARLTRDGFTIENVQPLDMFPQTPHIEVLIHLRRTK